MNPSLEQLPGSVGRDQRACAPPPAATGTTTLTVGGSIESLADVDRYRDADVDRMLLRPFTSSREALDGIARFGDEVIAKLDA